MVSHEKCMAEIVDRFIEDNDPNDEIGKEVYASMRQTNWSVQAGPGVQTPWQLLPTAEMGTAHSERLTCSSSSSTVNNTAHTSLKRRPTRLRSIFRSSTTTKVTQKSVATPRYPSSPLRRWWSLRLRWSFETRRDAGGSNPPLNHCHNPVASIRSHHALHESFRCCHYWYRHRLCTFYRWAETN